MLCGRLLRIDGGGRRLAACIGFSPSPTGPLRGPGTASLHTTSSVPTAAVAWHSRRFASSKPPTPPKATRKTKKEKEAEKKAEKAADKAKADEATKASEAADTTTTPVEPAKSDAKKPEAKEGAAKGETPAADAKKAEAAGDGKTAPEADAAAAKDAEQPSEEKAQKEAAEHEERHKEFMNSPDAVEGFEDWYPNEKNPNIPNSVVERKKRAEEKKAASKKLAKKLGKLNKENSQKEGEHWAHRAIPPLALLLFGLYALYSYWSSLPGGELITRDKLEELLKKKVVVRVEVQNLSRAQLVTNETGVEETKYYFSIGDPEVFEFKFEALQLELLSDDLIRRAAAVAAANDPKNAGKTPDPATAVKQAVSGGNNDGLAMHSIPVVYRQNNHGVLMVMWECSIPLLLLYYLVFRVPSAQRSMMSEMRPEADKKFKFEKELNVSTTFKNVAGLRETKQEIMEVVDFLKSPEKYQRLGAKIPKGVLLTGPPGVGKTLLAKATAGESKVPFFSVSGSDFMEVYVGVGPARVRELFSAARLESPCIVFIDEIDAIGRKRQTGKGGGGHNSEQESTLNSILVEMDGFGSKSGVVVLAGTNRADILDKALLRPGRFDRQVQLDKPPLADRIEIFNLHLKPITLHSNVKKSKVAERLASLTPGFSGADIMNTCNEAALIAARSNHDYVSMSSFEDAIEKILGGLKKEKKISPKEKRMVAYHEAGHVIAGWHLKHTDPVLKVSIVPRGGDKLGYTQHLPKDKYLSTQEELVETMVKLLGGRVAEEIEFGVISTGAADDMYRVTNMAKNQMTSYGFCPERIGHFSFPEGGDGEFVIQKPYSSKVEQQIDVEVDKLLNDVYTRTNDLLTTHWDQVKLVAEKLLEKEEVTAEELVTILGPHPHASEELGKYLQAAEQSRLDEVPANKEQTPSKVGAEEGAEGGADKAKAGDEAADVKTAEASASAGDAPAEKGAEVAKKEAEAEAEAEAVSEKPEKPVKEKKERKGRAKKKGDKNASDEQKK